MPVDLEYLRYCQPGSEFYEPSQTSALSPRLDQRVEFPSDWTVRRGSPWTMCSHPSVSLPRQGWKIHLSSTRGRSREVLRLAADYCFANKMPFKYLSTEAEFDGQNAKYADRGSAGKFVTVYPPTIDHFRTALESLEELLGNEEGPYILSDRRWGRAPIYYRYGAFVPPASGSKFATTLITPDGLEVEDVRRPTFIIPDWIDTPDFLHKNSGMADENDFPFRMVEALHFSNGGGVYVAEAITDEFVPAGTTVVLKEARPHAGIDLDGVDAVERLAHEAEVLNDLQDTGYAPRYFGTFQAWEHHYAVMEHIPGHDLKRTWMLRTPVLKPHPWELSQKGYLEWLSTTVSELDRAVSVFHDRGWLLGDIHPKNVIMRDGVHPVFIDFEFAHPMDDDWRSNQGAPGYEPAPGLGGAEADRWSLGMMELDLILPQATVADQSNHYKIEEILRHGETVFSVPRATTDAVRAKTVRVIGYESTPLPDPDSLSVQELMRAFADGVSANISFDHDGPVVPADIAVYGVDGDQARIGFPYGLVGVLAALNVSGQPLDDDLVSRSKAWIRERLGSIGSRGFAGREGIEFGLREAGITDLLPEVRSVEVDAPADHSYWSGWAGVGLHALSDADRTADDAEEAAEALKKLIEEAEAGADSAGLLYGWSGPALFWGQAYQRHERRSEFLDLAREAIKLDLARCSETSNNTMELDETWRTLPYLGVGSVAIALAIRELAKATGRTEFGRELDQIHRAATYNQYAQAGFATGVGGFLSYLNRYEDRTSRDRDVIDSHIGGIRLHALRKNGGLLTRGNQGLRLSCDFQTGTAGVVGALAALDGRWSGIPFLPGTGTVHVERR